MKNHDKNIITYNTELLFDNIKDQQWWFDMLLMTKDAYNECSKIIFNEKLEYAIKPVHNRVYDTLRKNYPKIPSQGVIKIEQDVISAYRSIKANKQKLITAPRKKELNLRIDKRLYARFIKGSISLTAGYKYGKVDIKFNTYAKLSDLFNKYVPCDPMLFVKNNKLYLSIPFDIPLKPLKDETCIGVDLGERRLAISSDGIVFNNKEYNKHRRQVRYLKRCLQSKNTKSARRHLRKIRHKELHQCDNICHLIANNIIKSTDASIIVLEDLSNIKQKTKKIKGISKLNTNHNRRFSQVPLYKLKQILTYKALLAGKQVETVSPYLTSQKDCITGKQDGRRQNRRYYSSTGKVFDADWNAAINIARKSEHPFSFVMPLDGTLRTFKAGRMSTGQSYCKPTKSYLVAV